MPQVWPLGDVANGPRPPIYPVWVSLEALSVGRAGLMAGLQVGQAFGMFFWHAMAFVLMLGVALL